MQTKIYMHLLLVFVARTVVFHFLHLFSWKSSLEYKIHRDRPVKCEPSDASLFNAENAQSIAGDVVYTVLYANSARTLAKIVTEHKRRKSSHQIQETLQHYTLNSYTVMQILLYMKSSINSSSINF